MSFLDRAKQLFAENVSPAGPPADAAKLANLPEEISQISPTDGGGSQKHDISAAQTAWATPEPADSPNGRDSPAAARAEPLPGLYHQWFAGIHEPRAVVTLTEAEAKQAVTAGLVTQETAWASVLVAIRSPLGAVGLMAIPREKYDGIELMRALEAAPWVH